MIADDFFSRSGRMLLARGLPWREVGKHSPEYPVQLAQTDEEAPNKLWVAGRNLAELPTCIAIVGTRRPNGYGLEVSRRLAADLAQHGACIVSGMALGIDAQAHRGALEVGGFTVAVLGSGVDVCQPVSNADLYRTIAERGTLVSEQEPGTPGFAQHFVPRNRIIAGLCAATVVVQAAHTRNGKLTGAMVTAKKASDYNRDVFAVPGLIDWTVSSGTHFLIKSSAAYLCTGAGDVAQILGQRIHWTPDAEGRPIPPGLPAEQRKILETLSEGAMTSESICAATGIDAMTLLGALGTLELARLIAPAPGGRLRRIR